MKKLLLVAVLSIILIPTASPAATNLLVNPGFEDGVLDPWTGQGDWAAVSGGAHSGAWSARCTTGNTVWQDITPTAVGEILEVSIWCRSPDMVEHPVQLYYSAGGGDWDEFLHFHSGGGWTEFDLTSNLRGTGQLHGILVYGSATHEIWLDDAAIMVEDTVGIDTETWTRVKGLYR